MLTHDATIGCVTVWYCLSLYTSASCWISGCNEFLGFPDSEMILNGWMKVRWSVEQVQMRSQIHLSSASLGQHHRSHPCQLGLWDLTCFHIKHTSFPTQTLKVKSSDIFPWNYYSYNHFIYIRGKSCRRCIDTTHGAWKFLLSYLTTGPQLHVGLVS